MKGRSATLSTSDIKRSRGLKTAFGYLLISLFCVLFGAVYEHFGRGVYSYFMIYNFVIPLVGGTLVFFLIGINGDRHYPNAFARNCYHAAIATLTVGFIIQGVLDIFGTTNRLTLVYWIGSGILFSLAVLFYFRKPGEKKKEKAES